MKANKLGSILSSLDQFGAISQISFMNNDIKFKTIYGGIISLFIYSTGLTYFIYLMCLWHTNQIPPNVSSQTHFIPELRYFKMIEPLFVFSLEMDHSKPLDKDLEKEHKLYNYQVYSSSNNYHDILQNNPNDYQCFQTKSTLDYFSPICANLQDEWQTNLAQNSQNRSQDVYMQYYINFCDSRVDDTCIKLDQQSLFLGDGVSNWRLTLITQNIDLVTGSIVNIPQDFYFQSGTYLDNNTLQLDLKIKKAIYVIDDGILFPNERVVEVVQSILLNPIRQYVNNTVTGLPVIAYIGYNLDRQEQIIRVTYPKLGQVFAELGSIFQILLFFGIVINQFNSSLMEAKLEEALLKIYFPLIDTFTFKNDWWGKITSITCNKKLLNQQDYEEMKLFRETSGKLVKEKLNYTNILHDISRLQISQQFQLPRNEIVRLQDLGYRIKLSSQKDHVDQNHLLDYEDFLLFTSQKYIATIATVILDQNFQEKMRLNPENSPGFGSPISSPHPGKKV